MVQQCFLRIFQLHILTNCIQYFMNSYLIWCHGVVVITTAQLHSIKPELRFCTGSNPACSMMEIHNDEDLWQWSQLEIRLNAFHWSTIPQKQFIIIIIINSIGLLYAIDGTWTHKIYIKGQRHPNKGVISVVVSMSVS